MFIWLIIIIFVLVICFAMGIVQAIYRRVRNLLMKDPVRGTLQVTATNYPPTTGAVAYSDCKLSGIIIAEGLKPTPFQGRVIARVSKWPAAGSVLPVIVDRQHPTWIKILWKEVLTGKQKAIEETKELADEMAKTGARSIDQIGTKEVAEKARVAVQEIANAIDGTVINETSKEAVAATIKKMSDEAVKKFEQSTGQTEEVVGAPGRPLPGAANGGTTPEQAAALLDSGEQATARVVAVQDVDISGTSQSASGTSFADITFEVQRKDGSFYKTSSRIGFSNPERKARIAIIGAELPVRIDPKDTSRIAIDTKALKIQIN